MDVCTAFPVGSWVKVTYEGGLTTLARVSDHHDDSLIVDERHPWLPTRWSHVGVHTSYCEPTTPSEEDEAAWLIATLSH